MAEYAILAILFQVALGNAARETWSREYWRTLGFALLLAILYSATDEIHQAFVPSRIGSVVDVLIDSCGAACGLAGVALVEGLVSWARRRWRTKVR